MTQKQTEDAGLGNLIGDRLRARQREKQDSARSTDHVDADTLAAFVEGRVEEPGATIITSHLIACSACRRASARIIHLVSAIPLEDIATEASTDSPSRLRQFVDDLAARVFPLSDGDVVFAYQDPSVAPNSADETNPDDSPESEQDAKK